MPIAFATPAGSVQITAADTPADVHGLVVHADGFTVAAGGRAFMVTMAPEVAAEIARHLLRRRGQGDGEGPGFGRYTGQGGGS